MILLKLKGGSYGIYACFFLWWPSHFMGTSNHFLGNNEKALNHFDNITEILGDNT